MALIPVKKLPESEPLMYLLVIYLWKDNFKASVLPGLI
jgi:hypothetical protein